MLSTADIINSITLECKLKELHEEDVFKIKSLQSAIFELDKLDSNTLVSDDSFLEHLNRINKYSKEKIKTIISTNRNTDLEVLMETTPASLLELFELKGIGAKKIRMLWKELNITSISELKTACEEKKIENLKGFGVKTQDSILESIQYNKNQEGKVRIDEAEARALLIETYLEEMGIKFHRTGELRRRSEIVNCLFWIIETDSFKKVLAILSNCPYIINSELNNSPFDWRGFCFDISLAVQFRFSKPIHLDRNLLITTPTAEHLGLITKESTLLKHIKTLKYDSELDFYENLVGAYVEPELREGRNELTRIVNKTITELVKDENLTGIFHNHSKYSDGVHSIEEMVQKCIEMKYSYFGISDHSQSAYYANGLKEDQIFYQHLEIDKLNEKYAPFKIYKGIESDILADGSLDYPNEILETFDYIVSSIHSGFVNDIDRSTKRLIKAIENNYTSILGHLTGRVLLNRDGYPVNHQYIIDACASNRVAIEINAHPSRLDMDWRYLEYAINKGVWICINPDAHSMEGIENVRFGIAMARKGGLSKEHILNCQSIEVINQFFEQKK